MKHSKAALRALCLLLALLCCACGAPNPPAGDPAPSQAQASEVPTPPAPTEVEKQEAAGGEQGAPDEARANVLREVGYANCVWEVPGGFVSAVEEIAPELDENGHPYTQWQLYRTDITTRTSEKIEGALFVPDSFEQLDYAYPFYANDRLYLMLAYHLYSVNLDGSDARLEYSMPTPPYAEDIHEELTAYEGWLNSWYTDGESLYFVRKVEIVYSGPAPDEYTWYNDTIPWELVRLHLPSGDEKVLYAANALYPLAIEDSVLYLQERRYETDLAQFYDENHRLVDEAGYRAALESEWEQLVAFDTHTSEVKPVADTTPDGRALWYRRHQTTLPPLASAYDDEGDLRGLYYYDIGADEWVPLQEEKAYGAMLYYDVGSRRLLAIESGEPDEQGNFNLQYSVLHLPPGSGEEPWQPFGVYGYQDITAAPIGVAGGYYVLATSHYRTVGYAQDGVLVVQPTGEQQPGSELGDIWPYVVGTQPVYQLIEAEDFWAGNANLLPVTVL